MDPEVLARLWGVLGEPVPPVDPVELKTVWINGRAVRADKKAVGFRKMMLRAMVIDPTNLITPWVRDGLPQDAVFRVMATIEMKWPDFEATMLTYPFDTEDFLRQLNEGTGKRG